MGRTVYAEEKLLPDLLRLAKNDGYVPGLIIGQSSSNKDFVVHLARTCLFLGTANSDDDRSSISALQVNTVNEVFDISEAVIVKQAKQVTRMLPGGMWVLGIFIVGRGDVLSDSAKQSKLISLLTQITKNLDKCHHMYGNSPSNEKLILHLNSETSRYSCKSIDFTTSASFKSVDWKFQSSTRWYQLDCRFDCEQIFPYLLTNEKSASPLRKHLKEILSHITAVVNNSVCTLDGEVKDNQDSLEPPSEKRRLSSTKTTKSKSKESVDEKETGKDKEKKFEVNLYSPCSFDLPTSGLRRYSVMVAYNNENRMKILQPENRHSVSKTTEFAREGKLKSDVTENRIRASRSNMSLVQAIRRQSAQDSNEHGSRDFPNNYIEVVRITGEMHCTGSLSCRVFLNQHANVEEAIKAVKQDIIRSFSARLEMHWDSLVEEEAGSPDDRVVLHEPPHRVLIPLPYSKVVLCDYLFPGEAITDALSSLQELLGLDLAESSIIKDFEGQLSPSSDNFIKLYEYPNDPESSLLRTSIDTSADEAALAPSSYTSSFILKGGIIIAVFVLIVSVLIRFLMDSSNETPGNFNKKL